jgi:hypothetical protein
MCRWLAAGFDLPVAFENMPMACGEVDLPVAFQIIIINKKIEYNFLYIIKINNIMESSNEDNLIDNFFNESNTLSLNELMLLIDKKINEKYNKNSKNIIFEYRYLIIIFLKKILPNTFFKILKSSYVTKSKLINSTCLYFFL